jgi:hypothetical protein
MLRIGKLWKVISMSETLDAIKSDVQRIYELMERLEIRMWNVEEYLRINTTESRDRPEKRHLDVTDSDLTKDKAVSPEVSLELKIGEYWLAHIGTIVLVIGLALLISYPFKSVPAILTSLIGYVSVVGLYWLSFYWANRYQYLSKILFVGSLVLLYFATLRLHFFSSTPVLTNKFSGLALLIVVLGLGLYFAMKRRSELVAMLMLFLSYGSCLVSDTTHFALIFNIVLAAVAVYLMIRFNWQRTGVMSMILAYSVYLLWLFNNPILGNELKPLPEHHNSLVYLFLTGSVFSIANLFRKESSYDDYFELIFAFLNSIGFFIATSIAMLAHFRESISPIYLIVSILYLTFAVLYGNRHQSKFATAIYASFGYAALSIAIFSQFQSPDFFIWLSWQSLLVVSSAIWFRSRIIIVVNFLIYLGIFIAYIAQGAASDFVNFSYAIVALVSARVLNWQKERLELQTDMIRNTYLASAFAIVLVGLYQIMPANYVSPAWLGAALFYFALSLALNNIKYRWLAIFTIFATIIRVFYVDMANLDAGFRILLFLVVGGVLLAVSLYYTKHHKKLSQI